VGATITVVTHVSRANRAGSFFLEQNVCWPAAGDCQPARNRAQRGHLCHVAEQPLQSAKNKRAKTMRRRERNDSVSGVDALIQWCSTVPGIVSPPTPCRPLETLSR